MALSWGGDYQDRARAEKSGRAKLPTRVSTPAGAPLVEAVDVSRSYALGAARVPAVRGVTLAIGPGEFVALQGPSGSGKTTLLNLLGLLDRPDAGQVRVEGLDGRSLTENESSDLRRDRFGFVFQTFNLIPVLTAEENVAYPMALAGVEPRRARRARAGELLASVGLAGQGRAFGRTSSRAGRGSASRSPGPSRTGRPSCSPTSRRPTSTAARPTRSWISCARFNAPGRVAFLFATHDPRVVARARRVVTLHDGAIACGASGR